MKNEIVKIKKEIKELEKEMAEYEYGSVAYDFADADLFELVCKLKKLEEV